MNLKLTDRGMACSRCSRSSRKPHGAVRFEILRLGLALYRNEIECKENGTKSLRESGTNQPGYPLGKRKALANPRNGAKAAGRAISYLLSRLYSQKERSRPSSHYIILHYSSSRIVRAFSSSEVNRTSKGADEASALTLLVVSLSLAICFIRVGLEKKQGEGRSSSS